MHECRYIELMKSIENDITEIRSDVKSLLKFKWQIIGGAGIVGTILAFIVNKIF